MVLIAPRQNNVLSNVLTLTLGDERFEQRNNSVELASHPPTAQRLGFIN
jgi:hypothetical protein